MSLNIYSSSKLDKLAQKLVENLNKGYKNSNNIFNKVNVIIPNSTLEIWLNMQIARINGVSANVEFNYLDSFLIDLIKSDKIKIINRNQLQKILIDVLKDNKEDLLILSGYLDSDVISISAKKMFQLTDTLSKMFFQYFLHRPDMMFEWENEFYYNEVKPYNLSIDTHEREIYEKIYNLQKKLWFKVLKKINDINAGTGLEHYIFPQIIVKSIYKKDFLNSLDLIRNIPVHIFGTSFISKVYLKFLTLFENNHLYLYKTWIDKNNGKSGNEINEKWNVPIREVFQIIKNIKNESSGNNNVFIKDLDERNNHLPQNNNLEILQSHILSGESENIQKQLQLNFNNNNNNNKVKHNNNISVKENDNSVKILRCKTTKREIEAVADEIISIMIESKKKGENLKLNEIAIISKNIENYSVDIDEIFSHYNIPFSQTDSDINHQTRLIQGFMSILNLAHSNYTKKDIYDIINHPNFISKMETLRIDVSNWNNRIDELSIYTGINKDMNINSGLKYVENDLFNWEQGFLRLILGKLISNIDNVNSDINGKTFKLEDKNYFPLERYKIDTDEAADFIKVINSLFNDTVILADLKLSLEDWAEISIEIYKTYLAPLENETKIYYQLIKKMQRINELEIEEDNTQKYTFYEFYEILFAKLNATPVSVGNYLAYGVNVSNFLPLRPIPFKVIFILGLEQDNFPAKDFKNYLDLRSYKREIGDIDARMQDNYMFLETLLSAQSKLCLSYIDHDIVKDRVVYPSVSITEIINFFKKNTDKLFKNIPLKNYSSKYFENDALENNLLNYNEEAYYQYKLIKINEKNFKNFSKLHKIENHFAEKILDLDAAVQEKVKQTLNLETRVDLDNALKMQKNDEAVSSSGEDKSIKKVSLYHYTSFLESPLQGTAKNILFLEDEEEKEISGVEPLKSENLDTSSILRETIFSVLNNFDNSESNDFIGFTKEILNKKYLEYELKGKLPTGLFRDTQKKYFIDIVTKWYEVLIKKRLFNEVLNIKKGPRFGEIREWEDVEMAYLPLEKEVNNVRLQINGKITHYFDNTLIKFGTGENLDKYLLQTFVQSAMLCNYFTKLNKDGECNTPEYELIKSILFKDGEFCHRILALNREGKMKEITFPGTAETLKEMSNYFETLTNELMANDFIHEYIMPYKSVDKINEIKKSNFNELSFSELYEFCIKNSKIKNEILNQLKDYYEKLLDGDEKDYGPVKIFNVFDIPETEDEIIQYFVNRYALFYKYKILSLEKDNVKSKKNVSKKGKK